ncbi:MAG: hypothetical protein MJZ34_14940 [Paludibacteraceae bacterium]|nr:hypothetical protein [Paludibacteraceae bacterium]
MEDLITDDFFGALKYKNNAWFRRTETPLLNSHGNLILVIQDVNKEGILDVQREAYKTYLQNEEKYKNSVTDFLLDYYKWRYEFIASYVSDIDETYHKDVVTDKQLYNAIELWYLFICRDGSFGFAFGCCWDVDNGIAVLLSESEPRVISRTQLEHLHKLNDPTLGLLVHDGKKAWKGLERNKFFGKLENLEIELEGGAEEGITPAQQKAYADYLAKKDTFFKAMMGKAKIVYNNEILPKTIFIDRQGNYGWKCYTAWNGSYISVILSDGEVKMGSYDFLYHYKDVVSSRRKKKWYLGDSIYIELLGQMIPFRIEYAKEDDYEDDDCKLTDEENDLVKWLIKEADIQEIENRLLAYRNAIDDGHCEKVDKAGLLQELQFETVYLNVNFSKSCENAPDISIAGECDFDPDHGIAVCFRDKKLLKVGEIQAACI